MSNLFYPPEDESEPTESEHAMKDGLSAWDEVRRLADELEVKIHLAGMEARDRWRVLEPRLTAIERKLTRSGKRAGRSIMKELSEIRSLLERLRADLGGGGDPPAS